jgi:hypothetical protein
LERNALLAADCPAFAALGPAQFNPSPEPDRKRERASIAGKAIPIPRKKKARILPLSGKTMSISSAFLSHPAKSAVDSNSFENG